ncbi:MAG: putative amidohydrolase/ribosomal protein S18 acetylase RimI-like enzyme [Alphaproteobacteria bacterium]|jgi:predicted amidohydrolase/ribosomal protein S18 acetylase RimI-like enzyme
MNHVDQKAAAAKPAKPARSRSRLVVRRVKRSDIDGLAELSNRVYEPVPGHSKRSLRAQLNNFPDGQFVAEYDGKIVGHCATFIIDETVALAAHTWDEITGQGTAARHDDDGDVLYGMEVSVDPRFRRLRIGQRLYDARKQLCQTLGLKGIVFGGRMPGLARRMKSAGSAQAYVEAVVEKKYRDTAIGFHLANEFEVVGVLKDYDASDRQSLGYATHMFWRNPVYFEDVSHGRDATALEQKDTVRVATVQFQMRVLETKEEFEKQIEYFVDVASDYRSDFVVFPELFTLQLLSLEEKPLPPDKGIERVSEYTAWFTKLMERLAVSYNVNIIGGSHPTRQDDGEIHNICYVFLRDGSVHMQKKIHPTPDERKWWNIKGGSRVDAIDTDCGPIGVLICYDAEFPELARQLADQGAMLLFVPFCTDERRGYLRVRYCSHARAIENQVYVILSGVVGNLPNVENMDIHYAESCILTPCDFAFARDGVAADTAANTETIAFADLRLSDLRVARQSGTTRNFRDRRFDLYRVVWNDGRKRPLKW